MLIFSLQVPQRHLFAKTISKDVFGEGIIIPAHSYHHFNANEQFKMLSTVIKSGYED